MSSWLETPLTPETPLTLSDDENAMSPQTGDQNAMPERRSRSPQRSPLAQIRHREEAFNQYRQIAYEFIPGQRLNSKLLHATEEHQIYSKKIATKKDVQYNCTKERSGCPAKLFIDISTNECVRKAKQAQPHNHGSMRVEIAEMMLKNEIRTKCGNAVTLSHHIGASGSGNVRGIFQHCLAKYVFLISLFTFPSE